MYIVDSIGMMVWTWMLSMCTKDGESLGEALLCPYSMMALRKITQTLSRTM